MPDSSFQFSNEPFQAAAAAAAASNESTAAAEGTDALCGFHQFAVAAVLSGGAGIRATMPAFLLSLFHQMDGVAYPLSSEFHWLARPEICMLLGLFLVLEILADQIPAVDHALHAILVPAHPVAGAAMAAAPAYCGGALVQVPMAAGGAGLAGAIHVQKMLFRGSASAGSGGCLNNAISNFESVFATFAVVMSLLNPPIASMVALVMLACGACGVWSVIALCRGGGDEPKYNPYGPNGPHGPGTPGNGYSSPLAADPEQAFSGYLGSAPPRGPSDVELRQLLADAEAEAGPGGGLPPPNDPSFSQLAEQQQREAAFEVERVLICPNLSAVLGGGTVHQRRQEFRRLLRLLHPDKGLAYGPRAAAALQRVVEANAALNGGDAS